MKRIILLLLFVISAFIPNAFAEIRLELPQLVLNAEDSSTVVDLLLVNDEELAGLNFRILFDENYAVVTSVEETDRLSSMGLISVNPTANTINAIVLDMGGQCIESGSGAIFTITFAVNSPPNQDITILLEFGSVGAAQCDTALDLAVTTIDGAIFIDGFNQLETDLIVGRAGLDAPYPNPSTGNIRFAYQLHSSTSVILKVYAVTGQFITCLISDFQTSGNHTILWPAANQPAGSYLLRLETSDFVQTRHFVIAR